VEDEFRYLWERGVPLPDAIVEEIGRCARKHEVQVEDLSPGDLAARRPGRSADLSPRRRAQALAALLCRPVLEHRETYDVGRFVLADEVGIGKTLSLATAAMVACLMGDGPALVLAPATLCQQWQVELKDKLAFRRPCGCPTARSGSTRTGT